MGAVSGSLEETGSMTWRNDERHQPGHRDNGDLA